MWPCGKDLIQQTRSWWGISMLFRHYPSISSAPSSWPSFLYRIYLCLSLRFHSPALLQTNGTKNSGKQMSLLLSWISQRGRVSRGRRVWSRVADDPGGASMWHYTTSNHSSWEKASLFNFFLDLSDYIWGLCLVLVFNTFLGCANLFL